MKKQIVFVDDICSDLSSKPTSIEYFPNGYAVVTEANNLIIKVADSDKVVFFLPKSIPFLNNEVVTIFHQTTSNQYLVSTNMLRFFLIDVNLVSQTLTSQKELLFKFGKSLKHPVDSQTLKIDQFIVFSSRKFIFTYNIDSQEFKILKLLNSDVFEMHFNDGKLFVLGESDFFEFECSVSNGFLNLSQINKIKNTNFSNFVLLEKKITFLTKNDHIVLYNISESRFENQINASTISTNNMKFVYVASVKSSILVAVHSDFLVVFNKDQTSVENVIGISNFDYIVCGNKMLNMNRKTDKKMRVGHVCFEDYTQETRRMQFEKKTQQLQFCILKSYLLKKFFKKTNFSNQIELLRELLLPICLKKTFLKNPKLKSMVVDFFGTVKAFSREIAGRFFVNRVILEDVDKKRNSASTLDLMSHECETVDSLSQKNSKNAEAKMRSDSITVFSLEKFPSSCPIVLKNVNHNILVGCGVNVVRNNCRKRYQKWRGKMLVVSRSENVRFDDKVHWFFYISDRFCYQQSLVYMYDQMQLLILSELLTKKNRIYRYEDDSQRILQMY